MNKDQMAKMIIEEMEHIDEGARGSPQALLRMLYAAQRRKQLGRNPDADRGAGLRKALARTQREYPYFIAGFDTSYFRIARGTLAAGSASAESFRAARDPGFRPRRVEVAS